MIGNKALGDSMDNSDKENDSSLPKDQGKEIDSNLPTLAERIQTYQEEMKVVQQTPEKWIEHCKSLVFEYRTLFNRSKSNYYKKDGDVGYLISMNWLEKWKKLVYYDQLYRNLQPEYDAEKSKDIPEIDNESLIRDQSTILTDVDPNSYLNFVLKPNIKMNVDYKVVEEEIWDFFRSKYGGVEIKRFFHKTYSFGAEIEAKLKEFKIVLLPTLEKWEFSKITEPKSIFASKHDKFKDLLDRLVKIFSSEKYGMTISADSIRTWKLGYNGDLERVNNHILHAKNSEMEVEKEDEKEQPSNGKTVENNTGVKFPGTSLEMMKDFDVEDLEISSTDVIVIEQASPKTGKFMFYYEEVKILCYGKCEYCYSHKPLVIQCRCEEVKYCGEECMKKDERFHVDKCNAPIEMSNDGPFEKKARARNGLTGLQNLGNT